MRECGAARLVFLDGNFIFFWDHLRLVQVLTVYFPLGIVFSCRYVYSVCVSVFGSLLLILLLECKFHTVMKIHLLLAIER